MEFVVLRWQGKSTHQDNLWNGLRSLLMNETAHLQPAHDGHHDIGDDQYTIDAKVDRALCTPLLEDASGSGPAGTPLGERNELPLGTPHPSGSPARHSALIMVMQIQTCGGVGS